VNFIKNYFNYNDIADIQKLIYKVVFNNGIWNEIDRNSLKIPTNFIDKKVISRVNPNEAIIKIIKKCNMYVISLDNYKFCRNANLTENT
ncbi:hypothetical protein Q5M87_12985, partial [Brachyspira innocens]|nr:hypothetical protein [Brachyspira innocens]